MKVFSLLTLIYRCINDVPISNRYNMKTIGFVPPLKAKDPTICHPEKHS